MVRGPEGGENHPSRLKSIFDRLPIIGRKNALVAGELEAPDDSTYSGCDSFDSVNTLFNRRMNFFTKKTRREKRDAIQRGVSKNEYLVLSSIQDARRVEEGVQVFLALAKFDFDPCVYLKKEIITDREEAQQAMDLFNKTGKEIYRGRHAILSRLAQRLEEETRKRYPL